MATFDSRIESARQRGEKAGKARASWVFDGNTSQETYRKFLRGNEEGDPAIMDAYDWSPLSGEWAGESVTELLGDLECPCDGGSADDEETCCCDDTKEEDWDSLCTAYEEAARDAYWSELERVALLHVSRTYTVTLRVTIDTRHHASPETWDWPSLLDNDGVTLLSAEED